MPFDRLTPPWSGDDILATPGSPRAQALDSLAQLRALMETGTPPAGTTALPWYLTDPNARAQYFATRTRSQDI